MGSMGLKKSIYSLLALLALSGGLSAAAAPKTYQAITTSDRGGTGSDLSAAAIGGIPYLDASTQRKI